MNLPGVFTRYRSEIDTEMKSAFNGRESPLYDMLRYHLGWINVDGKTILNPGGKAFRPTLCLLACEAVCGDYRQALPAAAAIELIHNFSLIHDDIQDDDVERRHRPTVWSIWGKPQAINAGTAMRTLAGLVVNQLSQHGVSLEKQWRIQTLLDEACLTLIEGQFLDISYENRFDVKLGDYLDMINRKTAALIACTMEAGSIIGTDHAELISGLRRTGNYLGLAFQVRDDILGIWGNEKDTGKPQFSDIYRKKRSFPIVYTLGKIEGELRERFMRVYRDGNKPDADYIDTVLDALNSVDAQHQAQLVVEKYCSIALAQIENLPLLPGPKTEMVDLLRFLAERNF